MRTRGIAFLAVFIAFLFIAPLLASANTNAFSSRSAVLSSSNYTENLSVYLTSSNALWLVHLAGGSVNISSVSVPSSVSGFSISVTNYATWQSSYDIFTKYGFGILGNSEPYPDGALLTINGTSSSDATSLANSLGQQFGLAFILMSSSSTSFTFFSPSNYATELQTYLYGLIPKSAGGMASMFSETQLQSGNLNFFKVSYSGSVYSLTFGGLLALSSANFVLYSQLGLTSISYNYSSTSTSSSVDVYVLGGLIQNSSEPYTNHVTNISADIQVERSSNNTIPNISANLDFNFPTIVAYRQVTPTLTPASGSSVTVTITVKNINPAVAAEKVFVNDSWIYGQTSNFHLTQTNTANNQTLGPGGSYTVVYAFTVTATSGTFEIPATPVTYQYAYTNNSNLNGQVLLNPERLVVGETNTPSLEAIANLASGTQIQAGQPASVNVTIVNKGNGEAFGVSSSGLTKGTLAPGSSWSYISNESSSSLTQTNANLSYSVSWQDASGTSHNTTTNSISTILGFSSPGSPDLTVSKTVGEPISNNVNVTLFLLNNSPQVINGVTLNDAVPSGLSFVKSFNGSSIQANGDLISGNLSSIAAGGNVSFVYELSIGNPNNNYVFGPANVTSMWSNHEITHYSGGYGLPLGVQLTKQFSPSQGFQGSNVSISVDVTNNGQLPVYNVNVNNNFASFLTIVNSSTKTAAILSNGQTLSDVFVANLTGAPGSYNSSASGANFIFAGTEQSVASQAASINIFYLPSANLTYTALKVEEGHDITVTVTVTNPSNFTLTNISYMVTIPNNLRVLSGSQANFTIASLAPHTNATHTFTVITSQPYVYSLNDTKMTFSYEGHQLSGISGGLTLNIGDDVPLRYGIPVVIGLILVVGTVLYVRKLTSIHPLK